MADPKGFLKHKRGKLGYKPVEVRIRDFEEFTIPLTPEDLITQASRCVDCGIPFCHGTGCPVSNNIPDFNNMVYKGNWKKACDILHSTNNFPEFTGRVCPAPCETACTLSVSDEPVMIRHIELQIVERGFENGWIKPVIANQKTGKKVGIIGSGPAGLAAAQQLAREGHEVIVFERDKKPGGMLRYGIPDFKLNKKVIDRRINQMIDEGVQFQTDVIVGQDISARYLRKMFDAICLCMGSRKARDLNIPGRDLNNIHFAMDYLSAQNKIVSNEPSSEKYEYDVEGKNVVVIGGGDTGSDCVGTSRRLGAKNIYQLEILPKPPEERPNDTLWPDWPRVMRTSSSHEEGCDRIWSVMTKRFVGDQGKVSQLHVCEVDWKNENGKWVLTENPESEFAIKADMVFLAMGFEHVEHTGIVNELQVDLDQRGNVKTDNFQSSQPWIFSSGDTINGASLVVTAIDSGRKAADAIDQWLRNS